MTDRDTIDVLVAGLKVQALIWPLKQYASQAEELLAEHPMLHPEIQAASTHVALAAEALTRAIAYLDARLDAGMVA